MLSSPIWKRFDSWKSSEIRMRFFYVCTLPGKAFFKILPAPPIHLSNRSWKVRQLGFVGPLSHNRGDAFIEIGLLRPHLGGKLCWRRWFCLSRRSCFNCTNLRCAVSIGRENRTDRDCLFHERISGQPHLLWLLFSSPKGCLGATLLGLENWRAWLQKEHISKGKCFQNDRSF